jgi:hypothetical protein
MSEEAIAAIAAEEFDDAFEAAPRESAPEVTSSTYM